MQRLEVGELNDKVLHIPGIVSLPIARLIFLILLNHHSSVWKINFPSCGLLSAALKTYLTLTYLLSFLQSCKNQPKSISI